MRLNAQSWRCPHVSLLIPTYKQRNPPLLPSFVWLQGRGCFASAPAIVLLPCRLPLLLLLLPVGFFFFFPCILGAAMDSRQDALLLAGHVGEEKQTEPEV